MGVSVLPPLPPPHPASRHALMNINGNLPEIVFMPEHSVPSRLG
jgi:hypothetical protein